jgi:hypothetical protein
MAVRGVKVSANFEKLDGLRTALKNVFSKREMAAVLQQALERAIEPAYIRLREITPRGPTGNLLRAANRKTKAYPRDGNAVGLIGYNRSGTGPADSAQGGSVQTGPDRAFHQWWLEYGTKPRMVTKLSNKPYQRRSKLGTVHWVSGQNAYIASSYNRLGPFKIFREKDRRQDGFRTDPQYQKAFFKKSSTPIRIPAMRPGGSSGMPPVRTAFEQSQRNVEFLLDQELTAVLNQAVQKLPIEKSGSLSG